MADARCHPAAGTASLALGVRAWKSTSSATVYATWSRQLAVNPPPALATSSPTPTPAPRPSSPAPAASSPAPVESSTAPVPTENVVSADPTLEEQIVTVVVPVSGSPVLSPWMWLGVLMVVAAVAMLIWTVWRWRAREAEQE